MKFCNAFLQISVSLSRKNRYSYFAFLAPKFLACAGPELKSVLKIKNLLSFTNENKISNKIIWAIFRDSAKSSKKEPLNNEQITMKMKKMVKALKNFSLTILITLSLLYETTIIKKRHIIQILTKALAYVINGMETQIKAAK